MYVIVIAIGDLVRAVLWKNILKETRFSEHISMQDKQVIIIRFIRNLSRSAQWTITKIS